MIGERRVQVLRSESTYVGKQGLTYATGVTGRMVGARGLCLTHATLPPGARAKAHYHDGIDTAVYVVAGEGPLLYGDRLEHALVTRPGEYVFVPAGVPHAPFNHRDAPCTFVVAHSSGDDQRGSSCAPSWMRSHHPGARRASPASGRL